jgi:HKD family nuclease
MKTIQLVTNNKIPTHSSVIKRLLANSDETIICVAFLKNSGLNSIINRLSGNCVFYVGTDYFITEPSALRKIYKNHKIYLTKKEKTIFHPKIYYFRNGRNISIMIGSANLTGGGLENNFEVSALIQTEKGSSIDKEFKSMINLYSLNSTLISSNLQISQYEREFETYKKEHKKADKVFKDEFEKGHKINLRRLTKFVEEYIDKGEFKKFAHRTSDYKKAKYLLEGITKQKITSPKKFLEYYENITQYFHSSGLLRGKTFYAKKYKKIISIIKIVQKNKTAEPAVVFKKTLPLVHSIERFGVNALTEIMNTYNPNKFSLANGRTLKSLSGLGFKKYEKANNFKVETYKEYNDLIIEMAMACKFKNLGQVDHFLNWYYEIYVRK